MIRAVLLIVSCCLALSLAVDNINITVQWIRTAKENSDRLTVQKNTSFVDNYKSDISITVNSSMKYQTMLGFGGAFTDSAASVFSKLNASLQSTILDMYFSEKGIRYSMGRLPMGSCDFSMEHYTYDDVEGDTNLTHFSVSHDEAQIIPLIKRAMETREKWTNEQLNIVASPWGPPSWMKELKTTYCISCLGCVIADKYKMSWAEYTVKFISTYSDKHDIPIWGITVQNEPGACPLDYEGLHFTPETQAEFLSHYLGPKMKEKHPSVKILIYDHNKDKIVKWSNTIYSDKDAAQYVWGTAVHWYTGDEFPNLQKAHEMFPTKSILATEATVAREKNPEAPSWSHGEHYAHDMIGDFNNWVVGFIDWNLLLDKFGGPNHAFAGECEGIIKCGSAAMLLVDVDKQIIYPQIFYYYVGHISKYVPPGSVRIDAIVTEGNSTLESTGFITPDGQIIVVVMNTGDNAISFKLYDTNYDKAVSISALAHSIQTFMYTAKQ